MTVRIVLADDHAVVRSGLRMLLDAEDDLEVVAEAGDAETALRSVLGHKPDVLVLDLNMPGELTSLQALPLVPERSAATKHRRADDAGRPRVRAPRDAGRREGLRAQGGRRHRSRRGDPQGGQGQTYLTPSLAPSSRRRRRRRRGAPGSLRARGRGPAHDRARPYNAEIAAELYLSVRTVETHRAHVQQKLGLSTRAELVRTRWTTACCPPHERHRHPRPARDRAGRVALAPARRRHRCLERPRRGDRAPARASGFRVLLVARRADRLASLAATLPGGAVAVEADLLADDGPASVLAAVEAAEATSRCSSTTPEPAGEARSRRPATPACGRRCSSTSMRSCGSRRPCSRRSARRRRRRCSSCRRLGADRTARRRRLFGVEVRAERLRRCPPRGGIGGRRARRNDPAGLHRHRGLPTARAARQAHHALARRPARDGRRCGGAPAPHAAAGAVRAAGVAADGRARGGGAAARGADRRGARDDAEHDHRLSRRGAGDGRAWLGAPATWR